MSFIIPPENVIGPPINIKNVDILEYISYNKIEKVNHERYTTSIRHYEFLIRHNRPGIRPTSPKQKDFLQIVVVEASIEFTCISGVYKWTLPDDTTNTLKTIYNKLLTDMYAIKSL